MFTGDILLDRRVRTFLIQNGYDYPYTNVKKLLTEADITFGNLECPITDGGAPVFKRRDLIFKGDYNNTRALKNAGYDILNLANNHIMDQGREGLLDTINALKNEGLNYLGAGRDRFNAHKPVVIEKSGIKIGFLGYSDFSGEGYIYTEDNYGICNIDDKSLKEDITKAKESCEFLVVSIHYGVEFNFYPSKTQKKYTHLAVDSGADLVIGHHPHVLQGVEEYRGKYIFYSLGNFVFDRQIPKGTEESIILNIRITRDGIRDIEIIPVKIENCQPKIADESDREYIIERIKLYSKGINDMQDNQEVN